MRKIQVLGMVCCAIMALGVVVVSSAFGDATHLWAINGTAVTESKPIVTTVEILMEEVKNHTRILCSESFVGTINTVGKDEITLIEDLTGSNVEGSSNTLSITCNYDTEAGSVGPCEGGTLGGLIALFPVNLPWKTELVLVGTAYDDLISNAAGNPGYLIECTVLGIKADISCTGNTGTLVENETGGVLSEFRPTEETISPKGTCTTPLGNGENLVFLGGLSTSTAGTLSVIE
ncbi:MAG TPA: hypothetical protein VIJ39_10315 [Solirubrobacteraceae bacterium]